MPHARPWCDRTPVARVTVIVSPGAPRTDLVGRHGDAWKLRVAAPAERGKANAELREWLADALDVPRSAVRVAGGAASRRKAVDIAGVDAAAVDARLAAFARR